MKGALVFLVLIIASLASAVPSETPSEQDVKHEYPRFIKFSDVEGVIHDVDLEAEPDMEILNEVSRNPNNNGTVRTVNSSGNERTADQTHPDEDSLDESKLCMCLHRQNNTRNRRNAQTLIINNANSIRNSNFNANVPTVVVVHGWLSNRNTEPNPTVRDVYLTKSDVNVIILDWRRLALSDYVTAARGVPAVGRGLGQFLAFLNSVTGAPYNTMHLIGFSLGAHVVGNAGRELGGRVARITGLDPAGPLWSTSRNRLSPNDAVYVEAIHTDGGYTVGGLGIGSAVANADFFPNGGISQPGCLTNICNHNRAWELFAATVTHNHLVGRRCSSTAQITFDNCRGDSFHMGNDDLRKSGSGMYRLNTRRRYPY